jgi:hypothetical protein
MRRTALFLLALLAMLLALPLITVGGTRKDQAQTFLVYSVSIAGVILSLLTILAGCRVICDEQARRYIFAPLTKPVTRWQYVIGRWGGLVLFQAMMIAILGLAVYGTSQVLRAGVKSPAEKVQLDNQVFSARYRTGPSSFSEDQEKVAAAIMADRERNELLQGLSPEQMQASWNNARLQAREKLEYVAPFARLDWRFTELPRPMNDEALVEFHFTCGTGKAAAGTGLQGIFLFTADPNSSEPGSYFRSDPTFPTDMDHTIFLPARMIGSDGKLYVEFINRKANAPEETFQATLMFQPEQMYLIYPIAPFEPNFARLLLLMLILQVFLASTTLMAGTWLSFPVATLMCLTIYAIGFMQRFLVEAVAIRYKSGFWIYLGHYIYGALQHVMPNFSLVDTSGVLVDGLAIPWARVVVAAVAFVGLWTGLSLTVAALIFRRRELANVIVE